MNDPLRNEHLLNDVLAEETPANFRELLLDRTLRLARRRRHFRQARLAVLPLVLLAGLSLLVWRPHTNSGPAQQPARPYVLVRTQPLPPGDLVESQPQALVEVVISGPAAGSFTTAAAGYRPIEIGDEELLELAAPNPVVLVRHGSHDAQLVFANSQ